MTAIKESQASRILRLFRQKRVVTNAELNRICFRYSARILELRNDGHLIDKRQKKHGLFEYYYLGHVEDRVREYAD